MIPVFALAAIALVGSGAHTALVKLAGLALLTFFLTPWPWVFLAGLLFSRKG